MLRDLFIRFFVGGGAVVLVSVLARKGQPEFAGIVMTFPIITLISFIYVPEQQLAALGRSGLTGLGTAFIFILSCIVLHQSGLSRVFSILLALLICVAVIYLAVLIFHYR